MGQFFLNRSFIASLCVGLVLVAHAGLSAAPPIDFARDVRPILSEKCFHCHGPDAATRQADLRLDQVESAARVLDHSHGDVSELLSRITTHDSDQRMPPADARKQLTVEQVDTLVRWIESGAPYAGHWSFSTAMRSELPSAISEPWCLNPVDAFVLDALQHSQRVPSSQSPPATLLRRVHLDLTGLPPSIDEQSRFLVSAAEIGSDVAYGQLIERLMASPRYAEHMALPWLEAARFADTDGYQNDRYRYQHAWRDWVLRAYSENMPYDQFVIEQVAGDMLPEATLWQQVASGFGRNHRINSEDGSIPEEWLVENVVDRVDTVGTVFLGLTVGCARCHDHKYDPISQREYYQLFAYFNNIAEHGVGPNNGNSPPFVELPKSWPLISAAENRAMQPAPVVLKAAREGSGNGLMRPQPGSPGTVMVMHELSEPRETYLLVRGQYNLPDKSMPLSPDVPKFLKASPQNASPQNSARPTNRLELARWLVSPQNPLTARVAVNRIWQQFFGTGLVESSENFGSQGTAPSHPALLDWLADELVDSGWDVRHVQRLILHSATYRQSSQSTAELLARDPQNRWLARGPRRRLPAFVLRDQALAVSGLLVEQLGGPSVKPYMPADIWSSISNNKYEQDTGDKLFRRSLYTYWRRTIPPPTMMNFNAAAREVCTVRTELTNTPLQALTLMNNVIFIETAKKLAERGLAAGASDSTMQIEFCFQACTGRKPSRDELRLLQSAHSAFHVAYSQSPDAARELLSASGDAHYDTNLNAVDLASMTMTASLIMNLDETVTKE